MVTTYACIELAAVKFLRLVTDKRERRSYSVVGHQFSNLSREQHREMLWEDLIN